MTVQQTVSQIQRPANGSAAQFSFPNKVFQATDLVVTLIDPSGNLYSFTNFANAATGLSYTVQNVDADTGALVVFSAPPANGWTVDIRTQTAQTQLTSIKNQGQFLPELHEEALDKATRITQDLLRQAVTYSIRAQDIETSPWPPMPLPANRKGMAVIFDPVSGLPTAGALPTTPVTAGVIGNFLYPPLAVETGLPTVNTVYPYLNVKRYGAAGDGVTDDTVAIKTAWTVAKAIGGGTIVFPKATYLCASLDASNPSVNLPQQQSNGSQAYQPFQCAFYFQGGSHINFDFQGSVLLSTIIFGGVFMLFDNCTDIRLVGPTITGQQVQSTGVVSLGAITGGSGYTNGSYFNVPLTGGSGGGAVASITVSGGAVTAVSPILYVGGSYAVSDVLSCNNANIGGTGSGFSVPVTSVSGAGPTVQVASMEAICVTSLSGSSTRVTITDLDVSNMYLGVHALADPTTANTVSHISVLGYCRVANGEYGIAFHNGGDVSEIQGLYTFRVNRPFFFYGVQNVRGKVVGDQVSFGFQPIIKAYSRSCRNIAMQYAMINAPGQSGAVARVSIQVQCDPAVISPPPNLQQVYLDYDEANVSGSGGNGLEFDYFAGSGGTTLQSSTTNFLFNNFVFRGFTNSALMTTVQLSSAAAQCQIDYDDLQFTPPAAANDVSNANGFICSRKRTWSPRLNFGGASTGWNWTATGEFYVKGGMCRAIGQINVSQVGSSTGGASITLPLPTRSDSSLQPIGKVLGDSGMVGLTSTIVGILLSGTATMNLVQQGATGTSSLGNGNFSSSSVISFDVSYPV